MFIYGGWGAERSRRCLNVAIYLTSSFICLWRSRLKRTPANAIPLTWCARSSIALSTLTLCYLRSRLTVRSLFVLTSPLFNWWLNSGHVMCGCGVMYSFSQLLRQFALLNHGVLMSVCHQFFLNKKYFAFNKLMSWNVAYLLFFCYCWLQLIWWWGYWHLYTFATTEVLPTR